MDTLGRRIYLAHKALESKLGHDVGFEEYGRMIAKQEGRKAPRGGIRPYSGGNVLRWEKNEKRPSLEAIEAIAALVGMRPGFIAFGELPPYPENGTPQGSSPRPLPPDTLTPIETARRHTSPTHSGPPVSRRGARNR